MTFKFPRTAPTLVSLAALLSTPGMASEAKLITKIDLNTTTGAVKIQTTGPALEQAGQTPTASWLAQEQDSYAGTLPNVKEQRGVNGWAETGSYLTGGAWLPVADSEEFAHEITVTVPADQTVAGTGRILSNQVTGDTRSVTFAFEGPSKLLGLFAGPYTVTEQAHGDLTLRTYMDAPNRELSTRYLEASAGYIDRYQALIGPYPYEGFSVVAAPIPVGAAFPGLTYVGSAVLSHSYMTGRSLAHEILHNWWGNAVRVDYEAGNWAEGLTTYLADYTLAEDQGADAARQMRVDWITALDLLEDDEMQPLTSFRYAAHDGNQSQGYGKAAYVFHMLRSEIGEAAFTAGLQEFYRINAGQKASWSDLQAAFERSADRDLSAFFAQWLTRAGLPHVTLASATALVSETHGVVLNITQTEPTYDLTLPVTVTTEAGVERHVIELSARSDSITLPLKAAALSVQLDPDFDVARHPVDNELSPTLSRAFELSGFEARLADASNPQAEEMRETLDEMLPKFDLDWDPDTERYDAALVFGSTEELADLYLKETGQVFPYAQDGEARAWVDYDKSGVLTLYMSADSIEDLGFKMRFLGYYESKSYVSFKDGRGHSFGVVRSQNAGTPVASAQ
ncbi:M1 family metallopeptidase [Shimia sp.]|uniref:M1 family metallopeptidase n=1 Tax=Shimia sp. TaxID=1954381 RepID=UPI003BAD979D